MNPKPSDLMLNIIEFFGVLIPGATLFFLHGEWFLRIFCIPIGEPDSARYWVLAFFVSIIIGHLLLGASDFLDGLAALLTKKKKWYYYLESAKIEDLKLPDGVPKTPKNYFYCAFSFLRVHNEVAVTELERLAADKKPFRSLTLLFLIDIPLYILSCKFDLECSLQSSRILSVIVIICLVAIRYLQLFKFVYAVAFDLYLQVREAKAEQKPLKAKPPIKPTR